MTKFAMLSKVSIVCITAVGFLLGVSLTVSIICTVLKGLVTT